MKAILFCVCAVALCASVLGKTFTPAEIPCACKLFYHEVFDAFDEKGNKTTRIFTGFVGIYGRYMTQSETEEGMGDVFGVVRLDMPGPEDPKTASLYFGIDRKDKGLLCMFVGAFPYDNLYAGLGFERGYFLDKFSYNTTKKAVFKGVDCTAYIYELKETNETMIHYVNSENRTIGYNYKNATVNRVWNATYQLYSEYKDFRMPKKYPGCAEKVYENVANEPKCSLTSDSSSASSSSAPSSSTPAPSSSTPAPSSSTPAPSSSTPAPSSSTPAPSSVSSTPSASSSKTSSSGASTLEIAFAPFILGFAIAFMALF